MRGRQVEENSATGICSSWASARGRLPFTSTLCFEHAKNIDDQKNVSDALGKLFRRRLLARRSLPGSNAYEYVWHLFAAEVDGMEMFQAEPAAAGDLSLGGAAAVSVRKGKEVSSGKAIKPAPLDIPAFIRKDPQYVATPDGPHLGDGANIDLTLPASRATEQQDTDHLAAAGKEIDSAAIADRIIAALKPWLIPSPRVRGEGKGEGSSDQCRVRVEISQLTITVEGL